jgi:hypothetical protein
MNERIKELAEQVYGSAATAQEIKFAELIIQECCNVLKTETISHDGYGYNQGFLHKKIKEHFGVENVE